MGQFWIGRENKKEEPQSSVEIRKSLVYIWDLPLLFMGSFIRNMCRPQANLTPVVRIAPSYLGIKFNFFFDQRNL